MIRWKCEKCDKTWIYPIKKCLYCNDKIKRSETKPNKIIGFTKVVVPSPMHPIVPYNIILLEDDDGNRLPRKTMKDYKVGEEFVEWKAKTDKAVSIVKVKYDIYDAVKNSLELINFEVEPGSKVLIKPSIAVGAYPYQATCTNPKTIEAIIRLLIDKGIKKEDIVVAEQSILGEDTIKAAAKSGILSVCKKLEVKFIDLSKTEFDEKNDGGYRFKISKELLNKDLIINVPILKTHSQLGIVGALENMIRVTDVETQKEMARKNPDEHIAYLNKQVQYITIADGTIGMHATGPFSTGEPSFLNMILSSKDPLALDSVYCTMGMFDAPNYLNVAEIVGLGNHILNDIEIVGFELDAVKIELKKPNQNLSPNLNINVIDGRSWPGEYYSLYKLLSKFNNTPVNMANVVVGSIFNKEDIPGERVVAYGDNAIKKLDEMGIQPMASIKGDPPESMESFVLMKKLLTNEGEVNINLIDQAKSKIMNKLNNMGGK